MEEKDREQIPIDKEKDIAKYTSDILTIEGGGRKLIDSLKNSDGLYILDIDINICRVLNILPYNYKKWAIMENQIIKEDDSYIQENRIRIKIPGNDRLISDFANDVVREIKDKDIIFYRSDIRSIVEIGKVKTTDNKTVDSCFITLEPNKFITIIEKYFEPWTEVYTKQGKLFVNKSINSSSAKAVMASSNFQNNLPIINRIFSVQQPVIYNNELTFPKEGYDKRFGSWLSHHAPRISDTNMDLEKAKNIIENIYSEFCFKDNQSLINSIAGLLTPYIRGLFSAFNVRTPVIAYMANRERSGKDYNAGITGILYEGEATEEPPISNNERNNNSNDEIRKKILAAMIQGRKRFHSSNNKGLVNSAVFESVTTATKFSDRRLGKNEIVSLDNEIDYSLSGNIGMTLTPDLANRSIFVNLFFAEEDANGRKFDNPNLHNWIRENRELILSALYSLIRNWFDKGCPKGSVPFASFPEWSNICGGIMEAANLGNPCIKSDNVFGVSLDSETEDMKSLFELCHENKPDEWLKKSDIKEIIIKSNDNTFDYIDWDKKSDQIRFGQKLDKFVGRIFSDIKFIVKDNTTRASRKDYMFIKEKSTFIRNKEEIS